MEVLDRHALLLQNGGSPHSLLGADGGGEQGDVASLGEDPGPVELHGFGGGEETGHLLAEHPDVDGAIVVVGHVQHAVDLSGVADVEDSQIGHGAQHTHIVGRLVGHAAGGGDAGDKAHKDHGQIGIGHAHLQLVQDPAVEEHGKGVDEGPEALPGQTGCPGAHVLLCDAQGEVALRILLMELFDLAGGAQVGGHDYDLGVLPGHAEHVFRVGIYFNFHGSYLSFLSYIWAQKASNSARRPAGIRTKCLGTMGSSKGMP